MIRSAYVLDLINTQPKVCRVHFRANSIDVGKFSGQSQYHIPRGDPRWLSRERLTFLMECLQVADHGPDDRTGYLLQFAAPEHRGVYSLQRHDG